jgi:hypothetical protein
MKCVIKQPSYIPWRGFFDQLNRADLFIFFDDAPFDSRSWRNRNQIKTAEGLRWLSVPVFDKGRANEAMPLNQVRINWERNWNQEHFDLIGEAYRTAPYFEQVIQLIEPFYHHRYELLADFTVDYTETLAGCLGISHTRLIRSSSLPGITGQKNERLINMLTRVGADEYLSGPINQDVVDLSLFREAGIKVDFMDFDYPEYPQLYPPFEPQVSVLDLLFMTGPHASDYLRQPGLTKGSPSSEGEFIE